MTAARWRGAGRLAGRGRFAARWWASRCARDVRRLDRRVRAGLGDQTAGRTGRPGRGRGGRHQSRGFGRDRRRPRGHGPSSDGARQRARRGSPGPGGGARHAADLLQCRHRTARVTRGAAATGMPFADYFHEAVAVPLDLTATSTGARPSRDGTSTSRRPGPGAGRTARADGAAASVDAGRRDHGPVPRPARRAAGLRAAGRQRLGSGLRDQSGQAAALDRRGELRRAPTATSARPARCSGSIRTPGWAWWRWPTGRSTTGPGGLAGALGRRPAIPRTVHPWSELVRGVLADQAVDGLADQVGVPGVPGVLLDEVDDHPTQVRGLSRVRDRHPAIESTVG